MQRLSGTDSLFLAGETPAWHQHVAGLVVVDPTDAPGFGFDAIKKTVEQRLPLVPKFMWKLREVPLKLDRAVWVDDASFDIERHVHRVAVAPPGGPRETAAVVGAILGCAARPSSPVVAALVSRRSRERSRRGRDEVPPLPARRDGGYRTRDAPARHRARTGTERDPDSARARRGTERPASARTRHRGRGDDAVARCRLHGATGPARDRSRPLRGVGSARSPI